MIKVNDKNIISLEHGFTCPKCGGETNTYRHPFAKKWCIECGFILRQEGDKSFYDYRNHLNDMGSKDD